MRVSNGQDSLHEADHDRPSQDNRRLSRLALVSELYYNASKNQQEIADSLGIARAAVSRMLAEARERGVLEIRVNYPWRASYLEQQLVETFGLSDAVVIVPDGTEIEAMTPLLGEALRKYLLPILKPHLKIAVSWGSSLHQGIEAMGMHPLPEAEVIQVIGATGTESFAADGPRLAHMLSVVLNCSSRLLHAPLVVESPQVRDALVHDRSIKSVLEAARQADIALVGIGVPDAKYNNLVRTGYLDERGASGLLEAGAVGDICARYFDEHGQFLDIDLNHRVVGIDPNQLAESGKVIAVSGGRVKRKAVLAALLGGFVDVIITDTQAATYALSQKNRED